MKKLIAIFTIFIFQIFSSQEPSIIEEKLSPENEAIVQSVVKDLKIDFPVIAVSNKGKIKALKSMRDNAGVLKLYNTAIIFIDEKFLNNFNHNEKRYIIAHELMHTVCNHADKQSQLSQFLSRSNMILTGLLLYKAYDKVKTTNFYKNMYKGNNSNSFIYEFFNSFINGAIFGLATFAPPMLFSFCLSESIEKLISRFYSRKCELEADRKAAIALGKEGILAGISSTTKAKKLEELDNKKKNFIQCFIERLFSSHPTPDQRIEQLKNLKIN